MEEMSCLDLDQRGGADSHRARPAVPAALSPAVCATGRWPPAQRGWPAGRTTRRWLLLRHGAGQARSAAGLADPSEVVRTRVNLTGGNRSGLTGYRSNRSGPVPNRPKFKI